MEKDYWSYFYFLLVFIAVSVVLGIVIKAGFNFIVRKFFKAD